jgi:hypothetical protein
MRQSRLKLGMLIGAFLGTACGIGIAVADDQYYTFRVSKMNHREPPARDKLSGAVQF